MDFFKYFGTTYFVPPWPVSTLPKTVVAVQFSDGSHVFAETGSMFLTKDGWIPVEKLTGEYVLIEPISTLNVTAQHYRDTSVTTALYSREHSKFMRVECTYSPGYPIGTIGFAPNPGGFQPNPGGGGPSGGGSGGPCMCVLSSSPCGTALMLPVVITLVP